MRQMRVRIRRPSILSLYYQTMQLPIGSAGSEFSRRALASSAVDVSFFFSFPFSKRWSGLTPFTGLRRGTRSVNMIKGGRSLPLSLFLSLPLSQRNHTGRLITHLYFMQEGEINVNASRVNMLLFEDLLPFANKRQSLSIRGNCSRFLHESLRVSKARSKTQFGDVIGSQMSDSRRLLSLQTSNKLRNVVAVYLHSFDLRQRC